MRGHVYVYAGKIPPGIPAFKPPPVTIYDPADNRTHNFLDILQEEASALLVLPLLGYKILY